MQSDANLPVFNKRIFWDINFDTLDYTKRAAFIIERVLVRGDVVDIRACRRYYGDDQMCAVLTQAKWLPLNSVYLACALFNNELTDYKCYNTAQLNPIHWIY